MNFKKTNYYGAAAVLLSAAVLMLGPGPLAASGGGLPFHPEGTLKLESPILFAGSDIRLEGEEFHEGSTLRIVLVGLAGRFELKQITADAEGGFTTTLVLSDSLEVGAYRLVAVADDGDEVATLNVEVRPAVPMASEMREDHADEGEDEHGNHEHDESTEITAEPMDLQRAESPAVQGLAIVGILVAFAAGGMLLRSPKA